MAQGRAAGRYHMIGYIPAVGDPGAARVPVAALDAGLASRRRRTRRRPRATAVRTLADVDGAGTSSDRSRGRSWTVSPSPRPGQAEEVADAGEPIHGSARDPVEDGARMAEPFGEATAHLEVVGVR